jgi:ankyrin repeat protein
VSLQLEALWDECSTDADIRKALANLPRDLSETYDRCLTRISRQHSRFAQKILRWLCGAIRPLKIDQLREALAIDADTGCLDRENMPSAQELLKCCSNLITRDHSGQVLLIHHSVRQFLEDRKADARLFPTGFELNAVELELGKLCVAHLTSPDYALSLQPSNASKGSTIKMDPAAVEKLVQPISWMRFAMPKPRSAQISFPRISFLRNASKAPPITELSSFFHFAKEQWAPLTHGIAKDSNCWHKFRTLALEPNLSWQWHPWEPIGESLDSHYSGLLGWAIVNRHLPLLDLLFDPQNPKPRTDIFNLPFYYHNNLPALHLASRIGKIEITQRLLQVCDPRKTDNNGRTALHHAAETGHTGIVVLLVKKKANLKAKDDKGQTALHLAAGNGHEVVVRALIDRGADVNAKDNKMWTALFAAAENGHETTAQMLVELGADTNVRDNVGRTALSWAAGNKHEATVRVLVQLGTDVNAKDNVGRTLLLWAAMNGHEAVVKRLLARNDVEADSKDSEYGQTPLSWAAVNGHEAVVKLLLARNDVEADSKDKCGQTPLSLAAVNGHEAVVKLLLAHNDVETNLKNWLYV